MTRRPELEVELQLELLARHAPILRFDSRELFYPTTVESYIATSALVMGGDEILGPGQVTVDHLGRDLGLGSHLRFVSDQDRRSVVKDEARRLAGKLLGPRLGRVGFFGRILDALFLLSILFRPTTPRLTTVAASLKAERYHLHDRPTCYGRVVEVGDWLVLHYAYFYVMNDWRSGYRGVNDHEGDWEQAWIFCDPADHRPVWFVASSHENLGADLRRHWDDIECVRIGNQPVLFVGAGSHAMFFRPGDYVSRVEVPGLRWLLRVRLWARWALRIRDDEDERGLGPALGAPFVDAAPGNGREIARWDLRHLDDRRPCFGEFRGLWGLDTGDPVNSERAPSGPKFDRSGDIRRSWADPVGFAGLHGTSPPSLADPGIAVANIGLALDRLESQIEEATRLLPLLPKDGSRDATERSNRLTSLLRQRVELQELERRLAEGGHVDGKGIRDHLQYPAVPLSPPKESGWVLAVWASVSVPLALLAMSATVILRDLAVLGSLAVVGGVFSSLEQLVRRRFSAAARLTALYIALGLFVWFVGVISVSLYVLGAMLVVAAVVLFVANLGELRAMRRRAEVVSEAVTDVILDVAGAQAGAPAGSAGDDPAGITSDGRTDDPGRGVSGGGAGGGVEGRDVG
jgi:hypothetical protein